MRAREGSLLEKEVASSEELDGATFSIGRGEIEEVCKRTGLFKRVSVGDSELQEYAWAQESIADFLAAWYLRHRGMKRNQVMDLIAGTHDRRVAPQMRSVAVWIASLFPEVRGELARRDPHVLLAGDLGLLSDDERAETVEQWLLAIHDGRVHVSSFQDGVRLSGDLIHPGLANQVQRWMNDPSHHEDARREAVDIVAVCGLAELCPDLSKLLADEAAPLTVRVGAGYAAEKLGTPTLHQALRRLAIEPMRTEEANVLRRVACEALWPERMTFGDYVASLEASLSLKDRRDDVDARRSLVTDGVTVAQIEDGLRWLLAGGAESIPALAASAIEAAARAVPNQRTDELLGEALAYAAALDIKSRDWRHQDLHEALTSFTLSDSATLSETLVRHLARLKPVDITMFSSDLRRFLPADVPWLVRRAARAHNEQDEPALEASISCLRQVWLGSDQPRIAEAYEALKQNTSIGEIAEIVRWDLDAWAWPLEDEEFIERRQNWLRWNHPPDLPTPPSPSIQEHVENALGHLEADCVKAWRHVCRYIRLNPENGCKGFSEYEVSLERYAGWHTLGSTVHSRIEDAAFVFLQATAPSASDWAISRDPAQGQPYRILDGVKALFLLWERSPARLDALPSSTWAAWGDALLLRARDPNADEKAAYASLLARVRKENEARFDQRFCDIVSTDPYDAQVLFSLADAFADTELDRLVYERVVEANDDEGIREEAVAHLLDRGFVEATTWVVEQITHAEPERAAKWAVMLLFKSVVPIGNVFEERIAGDDDFARAFFRQFALAWRDARTVPESLPDAMLPLLARLLYTLLPPADDPPAPKGAYSPTPAHRVKDMRGAFGSALAARANPGALSLIAQLDDISTEQTQRIRRYLYAKHRREATFSATKPSDLFLLAQQPEARLAKSSEDFFEVVLATVEGFETWLRAGDAPRVRDLWNQVPRGEALRISESLAAADDHESAVGLAERLNKFRRARRDSASFSFPKPERVLANMAHRYLRERLGKHGVIVGQEAQIDIGHQTDLYVRRAETPQSEEASVVIEVKGSWHAHVYTELENQLADSYLDGVALLRS